MLLGLGSCSLQLAESQSSSAFKLCFPPSRRKQSCLPGCAVAAPAAAGTMPWPNKDSACHVKEATTKRYFGAAEVSY